MTARIELFVRDLQASLDFYVHVLGFTRGQKRSLEYASVIYGDVKIGLGRLASLPPDHPLQVRSRDERTGLGVEIVLEVDEVEVLYRSVLASGYAIKEALTRRPWGLTDFLLQDPDGYYLRMTSKS